MKEIGNSFWLPLSPFLKMAIEKIKDELQDWSP